MYTVRDITNHLEAIAPPAYQESYDNVGLVLGNIETTVTGVLICLDVTEAVLQEAKDHHCNLVIAHHPLIFKPLHKITGSTLVERCVLQAIQQGTAIYTLHTNLDNAPQGVSHRLATTLGLTQLSVLAPKAGTIAKLTTYVPPSHLEGVVEALHNAGAGHIGHYSHCSFTSPGKGTFIPTAEAQPHVGIASQRMQVPEHRLEVRFPMHLAAAVQQALQSAHPYEEAVYDIQPLTHHTADVGAGIIGILPTDLSTEAFLHHLKATLQLACVRHTAPLDRPIRRVAVCGGAGSALIQETIRQQADAFVTADIKYHDFFQAEGKVLIADVGHYESEVGTIALIHQLLSEKFANIALLQSSTITNPVHYA